MAQRIPRASLPLAELISGVLKHPECPVPIYNAIVDELADCINRSTRMKDYIDTPEDVARQLAFYDGELISS